MVKDWISRIRETYAKEFIFMLCVQFFNEGMASMKLLAIRDMFRDYMKLEPQDAQQYQLIVTSPMLFKLIFGIIIDARLIYHRKIYIIFFGAVQALSMMTVAVGHNHLTTFQTCLFLMANFFGTNFNDVVAESLLIQ